MKPAKLPCIGRWLVVVLAFVVTRTTFAAPPSFRGLGFLPGNSSSEAADISADGSVVVGSSSGEAFRWIQTSGMVGLGSLSQKTGSSAYGVSGDGSVVVGSSGGEAFRWTQAGGMTLLDHPPELVAPRATATSFDGSVIVGSTLVLEPGWWFYGHDSFRWTQDDGMSRLNIPNILNYDGFASDVSSDGSVVAVAGGGFAYVWTESAGSYLIGGEGCSGAYGVSADGSTVVGGLFFEAFRFTWEGGVTHLGVLGGEGDWACAHLPSSGVFERLSSARGVSADGSVIVGASSSATGLQAFHWSQARGMRSLRDMLVNDFGIDLTGWRLTSAKAVSDDGLTIIGNGINPSGQEEAWIAHIPQPVPGDMNCDGAVTVGDIAGFVLALTNPAEYANQYPSCNILNADINGDEAVTPGATFPASSRC